MLLQYIISYIKHHPIWSSGQDIWLSPRWPGLDSRYRKFFYVLLGFLCYVFVTRNYLFILLFFIILLNIIKRPNYYSPVAALVSSKRFFKLNKFYNSIFEMTLSQTNFLIIFALTNLLKIIKRKVLYLIYFQSTGSCIHLI